MRHLRPDELALIRPFPGAKPLRMDDLFDRRDDGDLTEDEIDELTRLVGEAEEHGIENARRLLAYNQSGEHDDLP